MRKIKKTIIANFHSPQELLSHHAKQYSGKEAIIAYNPDTNEIQKISYVELYELVQKTAAFLYSCWIKKGDRFAILMHNNLEVLLFELAAALIGVATVPLDYKRDTLDRKIYKLKETKSKALFVRNDNSSQQDISEIKKEIPKLQIFTWANFEEYLKIINQAKKFYKIHAVDDFESTYVVLYTSGTTAHPKGAILSLRACLLNAEGISNWQKFNHSDRFNIILPLHHINSTIFCLSMILKGGTIILNSRYSASRFWEVIEKFKVTNTSVVPTILHDLLMRFEEFKNKNLDISSLKRICIGSAPVLPEETLRFYKTFGVKVVQGYGQTETALRVAGVPVDVTEKSYIAMVKNNTIGKPLTNNELAIMDEVNNWRKENEEGEICIRGPILADSYLNDKEATKHAFKNGWFHSGDLGKYKIMNREKFYFIIGRIREIIIKGGVNLSPSAIEDALMKTFPEIDEVAVIGYPDTRMGEEIAAVIIPKKELADKAINNLIRKILLGNQKKLLQNISNYESPKRVFTLKELPKTSTGKIQRVIVKKMISEIISKEVAKKYFIRKINSNEKVILKKAVEINNSRFLGLPAALSEFKGRAKNGILLGAFEEKEGLVGSISCLRIDLEKVKKYKTWMEATNNGTLKNNNSKGDSILCVAISMKTNHRQQITNNKQKIKNNKLEKLAKQYIKFYVTSGKDYVINFHMKPKGGLPGATVWKILENGRKDDKESMGYNVIMEYPKPGKNQKIIKSKNTAPSVTLIEEVLSYAQKQGIKNVIAFSRPSGYREYLLSKI
ncbi:acyl--CoA ligase [Candidatus Gottesmanbacteria bacterium]|nr:acyl--CoA ligase [Candidatus Gottesmanbacteria bacterium]